MSSAEPNNRKTVHSSVISGEGSFDGDWDHISILFSCESSLTGDDGIWM